MQSLHERAERAEADAALRAERAQHEARDAIAREMHDVLGHRLSLLSVHAGALEYRPDAPAADVARAAAVIRQSAHQALQDLREVIGVLRGPVDERPLPRLDDIEELVGESRRAGMRVDLRVGVVGAPPALSGRTAYRIVQEGLTNARKHAAGSPVAVTLSGTEGEGLCVEVVDAGGGTGPRTRGEGPGLGLPGLGERVAISGGRIEYGVEAGRGWRLAAWLPWPA